MLAMVPLPEEDVPSIAIIVMGLISCIRITQCNRKSACLPNKCIIGYTYVYFNYFLYTFSMTEEILDLVDENDVVIGSLSRSEVYEKGMNNFRVINCFIKNSKGELWIPRRVSTKKIAPLGLGISCGGHVSSGETYEEAFAKEMREELEVDITKISWKEIGILTPEKNGTAAFMRVYEVHQDEVPRYSTTDFFEYFWLTPEAVLEKIEKGDSCQDDLPKIIKAFYI